MKTINLLVCTMACWATGQLLAQDAEIILPQPFLEPFHTETTTQLYQVEGIVSDPEGVVLIGVNIRSKEDPTVGTVTDENGQFILNIPDGTGTLVFSYIGYFDLEVPVNNRQVLDITMRPDDNYLSEVIVVGYGYQKKKDLTGSISSISTKNYEAQPVTRLDEILQGRASGVQVVNTAGAPGGDVKIRIRGANSIMGNNNPLYVIDGIIGADFSSLNVLDIASIQVLKDASATAIYGNRGANGVVLVTTRRGVAGAKPQVTFSAQIGFSEVLDRYDLMDAASFAQVVNERAVVNDLPPVFSAAEIQTFQNDGGTDWQDEIFETGWSQQYQLGVAGGNANTRYYISGSMVDQDGILINTDFQRYSLVSNLNLKVSEKIDLRLNLAGHKKQFHNTFNDITRTSPLGQALAWAPTTSARDEAGNYTLADPVGSIFQNPVALAHEREGQYNVAEAIGNIGAVWHIVEALSLDVSFGGRYFTVDDKFFSGEEITDFNPSASRSSIDQGNWQQINQLTYRNRFGDHGLTATAIFEQSELERNSFTTNAVGLQFPELEFYNVSLAGTISSSASYLRESLRSYIGRVEYNFQERYQLHASFRADGSSKFRQGNRFGYFPSVGAGWRVSEEAFFQNAAAMDMLKVRASWGRTGNQAIGAYSTFNLWLSDPFSASNTFDANTSTPGLILGAPGNPNLQWEETEQINIGLDLSLWNGRVEFTADVFKKNTTDLLIPEALPDYAGGGFIIRNAGEVENRGVELMASVVPVRTSDFSWTSGFNISFVENEIIHLDGKEQIFSGANYGAGLSTAPEFVLTSGGSMGDIWGLNYLGTWKSSEAAQAAEFGAVPGDARYEDLNDDKTITNDDMQIIGNGLANTFWGWNNTLTFKRLSLNIFLQGLTGFDKLNLGYAISVSPQADAREPTHTDILDRWVAGTNEDSNIPGFSATNVDFVQSSRFVEAGDFIRVKNITLSYDVPNNLTGFPALQVFVSGHNLFTITDYRGIDPETSSAGSFTDIDQSVDYGSYPNSRGVTFGVKGAF